MLPTYEHVCTYVPKMTCKVHVLCTIFLSATKLSFLFNLENVRSCGPRPKPIPVWERHDCAVIVMENVNLHVAHVEKFEAKFRYQEHIRTIAAAQYMCYYF